MEIDNLVKEILGEEMFIKFRENVMTDTARQSKNPMQFKSILDEKIKRINSYLNTPIFISVAFSWEHAPEGFQFWSDEYRLVERYFRDKYLKETSIQRGTDLERLYEFQYDTISYTISSRYIISENGTGEI